MGRHDQYLRTARNADYYLRHLWDAVQAMPGYHRGATMIVTTDHGRAACQRSPSTSTSIAGTPSSVITPSISGDLPSGSTWETRPG